MNEILELDINDINVNNIKELLSQQKIHVDSTIHLKNTPETSYTTANRFARYPSRTLLCAAILKKDHQLIDYLVSQNADINLAVGYLAPLHAAAKINDFEIFKKLHHLGADIHSVNHLAPESLLTIAISSNGSYDIVKYLIDHGVDVNEKKPFDFCYKLKIACFSQREVPVVNLLLDISANYLSSPDLYKCALRSAVRAGNREIVYLLIARGAKFYTYALNSGVDTCRGIGIIHDAVSCGSNKKLLEYLLSYDAELTDVNVLIDKKRNLLHYGLTYDLCLHKFHCQVLLDAGIDVNAEDSSGRLAIDYDDNNPNIHHFAYCIKPSIKRHIVKLIIAGLPVHQRNRQAVEDDFKKFRKLCVQEVKKMKINEVGGSNIKFLDVLFKSFHYLAVQMKFAGLDEIVDKKKLCRKYPQYGGMLFFKLSKVQRRIKYLEELEKLYEEIFFELGLPDTFITKLWYYFNNVTLKELVVLNTVELVF